MTENSNFIDYLCLDLCGFSLVLGAVGIVTSDVVLWISSIATILATGVLRYISNGDEF